MRLWTLHLARSGAEANNISFRVSEKRSGAAGQCASFSSGTARLAQALS
jgi:hypothetical protein